MEIIRLLAGIKIKLPQAVGTMIFQDSASKTLPVNAAVRQEQQDPAAQNVVMTLSPKAV
jgi:hypothetical protein